MLLGEELFLEEIGINLKLEEIPEELKSRQEDKCFIYCLCEPTTNEIRYIGITNNLKVRYNSHCSAKENTRKYAWVKSLKNKNLKPNMFMLTTILLNDFNSKGDFEIYSDNLEKTIIQKFEKLNYRLVNHKKLINNKYKFNPIDKYDTRCKKVYQFDKNFNLVMIHKSGVEASKYMKVSSLSGNIKKQQPCKGFYFSHTNIFIKKTKEKPKRKRKIIYRFDDKFNFIDEWESQVEIYTFFKVTSSTINGAIKNKTKCKGFYFSYEKEFNKIIIDNRKECFVYKLNGDFVGEFESIEKVSKMFNLDSSSVCACRNGRLKSVGGFLISPEKNDDIKYTSNTFKFYKVSKYSKDNIFRTTQISFIK